MHCVIVGFGLQDLPGKVFYEYEDIKGEPLAVPAANINPYLVDAPDVVLPRRSKPIGAVPEIGIGNKPIDDGNYLFTTEEKAAFLKLEQQVGQSVGAGFIESAGRFIGEDEAGLIDQGSNKGHALAFAARVAADPTVAALLGNPGLIQADATTLLAPEGADATFGNFLGLLFENRRLPLLPEIAGMFDELRFEAERVVKAKVTSAVLLPLAEMEKIEAALKRRFGRDVDIATAIDESLIGGAVIDAGDVVSDGSLKSKLGRLETALSH